MRFLNIMGLLLVALFFSACASSRPTTTKMAEFPHMYDDRRPLSILMLPPINRTTASDAKELYATTPAPLMTNHGYYFFPPLVVFDLMKQDGIFDTETLQEVPPQKFKEKFGADAILLVEITEWNTSYIVVGGSVTVGFNMTLRSTTTGEELWKRRAIVVTDTGGGNNNSGNGAAGLIAKMIVAAVKTATTDYMPIARAANARAVASLPYGRYHPLFDTDRQAVLSAAPERK